jgi:hypothetical protein
MLGEEPYDAIGRVRSGGLVRAFDRGPFVVSVSLHCVDRHARRVKTVIRAGIDLK